MRNIKEHANRLVQVLKSQPDEERKKGLEALYSLAVNALQKSPPDADTALYIINNAKALRIPFQGLDYLKAEAFLSLGRQAEALEYLKEELRWFPDHVQAQALLEQLGGVVRNTPGALDTTSFSALYQVIKPFTMVGDKRLQALYTHTRRILQSGLAGNVVECGVAGGGTSGLLAALLGEMAPQNMRLFCCDSFSGMPDPTAHDKHNGQEANDTGWGAGTCSAPESSVQSLCEQLGVLDRITIVKGYFEDTLPAWKDIIGPIALLHADGDWYSSTKAIFENLYDQVLPGAYIQVDDYGYWEGCRLALDEFFAARNMAVKLYPIDATGVYFFKPE